MSGIDHTAVIGLGWGDEGKGKVVDLLCPDFDYVIRFNGGANAGHTVCVAGQTFKLHLLPSGLINEHVHGVIGPGVVVDPATLIEEIDGLTGKGVNVAGRLTISDRAHAVMLYHKIEDRFTEAAAEPQNRIGTTVRGIGPCYADKVFRHSAIRMGDLRHKAFLEYRLPRLVKERKEVMLRLFGREAEFDVDQVVAEIRRQAAHIGPLIGDSTLLLERALNEGQRLLFEGANGCMLDIDHGTYPFVTSSTTTAAGIPSGAGVPPTTVKRVIGVCKAYSTRVGAGPFVSELRDAMGDWIRERGHEYGTTTGRPRRCGWFDAVATRYAVRLSGVTDVALMHLDTLSGAENVSMCIGYEIDGAVTDRLPSDSAALMNAKPVLETHPGWSESLRDVSRFDDLPDNARRYLDRLAVLIGAPVKIISVGPERSQTLRLDL